MAMVQNAQGQIFTVIDMEYKQLVLGNLADIIHICTLVMQVYIDAVNGQTHIVAVNSLHNFQCLADTVAAPFSVANGLEGQLDAIGLCNISQLIEYLYGILKDFLLIFGADFRCHRGNYDDIGIADLLRNFTAEGEQLYELFPLLRRAEAENPKLVHIDCDLMGCINTGKLLKAFPAQTFNAGIAEQNAMGVASGMAATGLTVFAHSFGCFAARRMFDQAFLAAGYSELPVHVIGSDPGVCAAFNGATHMPFEDCALYMNIPNAVVIDSCDFAQTKALTRKLAACGSPSYMRLIRKGFTTVYADGSDFEIGKGDTLRDGKDVTIIASGILVDEALKAEEMLAAKGISARVIDMHTWKPLDEELVLRAAAETGCIVTAENHQVGTGLGSAITNLTSAKNPVPVERIGIQNRFGQVGPQDFLMQEYNLTAEDIAAAALRAIARRQG